MHPDTGNWMAIRRAVEYYARSAHAFSAGIKCRHCRYTCWNRECESVTAHWRHCVLYSIALFSFYLNNHVHLRYTDTQCMITEIVDI